MAAFFKNKLQKSPDLNPQNHLSNVINQKDKKGNKITIYRSENQYFEKKRNDSKDKKINEVRPSSDLSM